MSCGNLKYLFNARNTPELNLVESIEIFGYPVNSLRKLLIKGEMIGKIKTLIKIPNNPNEASDYLGKILTEKCPCMITEYKPPEFYSHLVTKFTGERTKIHCLILYEKITPSIVEYSREMIAKDLKLQFIETEKEEGIFFVPIIFCIQSNSSYTDLFNELLQNIYLLLIRIQKNEKNNAGQAISSLEFIKTCNFLVYNTIIPPTGFLMNINIADLCIKIPSELKKSLPHNENCVSLLISIIDFFQIDVDNIIQIWEALLLSKHTILVSRNDYLLFLLIEAFQQLIYPLTWDTNIFLVTTSDTTSLNHVVPYFAGVNSTKVSFESIKQINKEAIIFDIENNILYKGQPLYLCECLKKSIKSKLNLVKIYFGLTYEKIAVFGTEHFERSVDDIEFIESARELLSIEDSVKKEKVFIGLVRCAFFEIFLVLSSFDLHVVKSDYLSTTKFNTGRLIEQIEQCDHCTLAEFWKNMEDSQIFVNFCQYYMMLDESPLCKFKDIIEFRSFSKLENMVCQEYNIRQNVKTKDLFEIIKELHRKFLQENSQDIFISCCAELLINELETLGIDSIYDTSEIKASSKRQNYRPIKDLYSFSNSNFNIFLGQFGVIRIYTVLVNPLKCNSIKEMHKSTFLQDIQLDNWQGLIIKLIYLLKHDKEDFENLEEMFELVLKINEMDSNAIPMHYSAVIIERVYRKDNKRINELEASEGRLGVIIERFLEYIRRPSSIYISS